MINVQSHTPISQTSLKAPVSVAAPSEGALEASTLPTTVVSESAEVLDVNALNMKARTAADISPVSAKISFGNASTAFHLVDTTEPVKVAGFGNISLEGVGDAMLTGSGRTLRHGASFNVRRWAENSANAARAFRNQNGGYTTLLHTGGSTDKYAGLNMAAEIRSALSGAGRRPNGGRFEIVCCYPQQTARALRNAAAEVSPQLLANEGLSPATLRAYANAVLHQNYSGTTNIYTNSLSDSGTFSFQPTNNPD